MFEPIYVDDFFEGDYELVEVSHANNHLAFLNCLSSEWIQSTLSCKECYFQLLVSFVCESADQSQVSLGCIEDPLFW